MAVTKTKKNQLLVAEREKRKLDQHQFAKLLGISQPLLSRLETGDLAAPSFTNGKRIAQLLNIPLDVLFPKFKV